MGDTTLFLDTGFSSVSVKLHPVVLFAILDHYVRRDEKQERVVGTLLGVNNDGVIEVKNSFPVRHSHSDQATIDYHKHMYELHLKANPKETLIGWYSTGSEITEASVGLQNDYWKELGLTQQSPLHIIVDTHLTGGTMDIKAFISSNLSFQNHTDKPAVVLGAQFLPVKLDLEYAESERIGVDILARGRSDNSTVSNLVGDFGNLEVEISKLSKIIETISEYVDKVGKGEIKADNNIGRFIMSSIGSMQKIDVNAFEKMFNNGLQDLLMVTYLSNLTRTQLVLAEKLQNLV